MSEVQSSSKEKPTIASVLPEEKLGKTWMNMAKILAAATQKAEKAAKDPVKASLKEMDEYVINFLRQQTDWSRNIASVEAKLQGQEREMENLQHYVRSQANVGERKRKREGEETKTE